MPTKRPTRPIASATIGVLALQGDFDAHRRRLEELGAKVVLAPKFPNLAENNFRKGFLEDGQYRKLIEYCPDLWFRSLVECGRTYGWRVSELLTMRALVR